MDERVGIEQSQCQILVMIRASEHGREIASLCNEVLDSEELEARLSNLLDIKREDVQTVLGMPMRSFTLAALSQMESDLRTVERQLAAFSD